MLIRYESTTVGGGKTWNENLRSGKNFPQNLNDFFIVYEPIGCSNERASKIFIN